MIYDITQYRYNLHVAIPLFDASRHLGSLKRGLGVLLPDRPTNLDAAVIELNADYLSWEVPKSHISRFVHF